MKYIRIFSSFSLRLFKPDRIEPNLGEIRLLQDNFLDLLETFLEDIFRI